MKEEEWIKMEKNDNGKNKISQLKSIILCFWVLMLRQFKFQKYNIILWNFFKICYHWPFPKVYCYYVDIQNFYFGWIWSDQ